jgi:hypothetical protein
MEGNWTSIILESRVAFRFMDAIPFQTVFQHSKQTSFSGWIK